MAVGVNFVDVREPPKRGEVCLLQQDVSSVMTIDEDLKDVKNLISYFCHLSNQQFHLKIQV